MTHLINSLSKHSETSALTKKIIQNEVRKANLIRCFMITGLIGPIALALSFYYSHYSPDAAVSFIDWKRSILDLNISIAAISTVLFVATLIAYSKPNFKVLNKYLPHVILMTMSLWGTICSVYDEAITSSILAFLLICVLSSIGLLIHPLRLLFYLTLIYLIFYIGLINTQNDATILLSKLSIGLITMIVCLGLATIQWRSNLTRFKQRRLIKTQKKELEKNYEQLLATSEELKKVNQSKDKFFSILAHDLRGPISSTLALTHYLEEGLFDKDEAERKRLYKLLQSSLDTTSKLLENILLWSRSQTGNISFKPIQINLYDCLQSNIEFLRIVAAQKDIQIVNKVDPAMTVVGDSDMMNTIFRNLLSNAIKFTPNLGKVDIVSAYVADTSSEKKTIAVSVIDYGIGMSPKTLGSLFQVENKTVFPGTNNEIGTGLGLVLCKEFILKHNGRITVESEFKKGSTFTITLPV
ncbi:sensor histidine kinase [Arcticibacter sp.]|uniref:sensor histidine kinase n=1 Tax=Arcticibacter sp. TaxID=1872630 RepID=UPI00388F889B